VHPLSEGFLRAYFRSAKEKQIEEGKERNITITKETEGEYLAI